MQHHHVEWVNQLFHTISTAVFNGKLLDYQAGYPPCRWNFNGLSLYTSPHGFPMGDTVHPRKISVRLRIQSLIMTMEDGFNAPGKKNRWHLVDWMGHKYPSMRSVTIFKPMFSIKMKGKPIGSFSCCPICLLHRDAVDSHIYDGWFPSWNHSFDFFAWQMVLRQYDNVCICIESSSAFHRSNAQHLVFNIDQPPRWLWHSQFAMV